MKKLWLVITRNSYDYALWMGEHVAKQDVDVLEIGEGSELIILDGGKENSIRQIKVLETIANYQESVDVRIWICFHEHEHKYSFEASTLKNRLEDLSECKESIRVLSECIFAPYCTFNCGGFDYQKELIGLRHRIKSAINSESDLCWINEELERLWTLTVPHRDGAEA